MKFSTFFSRENLALALRAIWQRFPQAGLISVLLTLYILYKIIGDTIYSVNEDDAIFRTITSLILTFFLSLGASLYIEQQEKKFFDAKFPILPVVYGIVFYFTVELGQNFWLHGTTYFFLHLVWFVSFAFFLPYVRRLFQKSEQRREVFDIEYTNYFSRVSWTFLMSLIVGVSLFALGAIAISAVVALFELGPSIEEGKWYGSWATLSLALIAPLYALREFPYSSDVTKDRYEVNRFFSFLVRYVATPAVYIYFIILYAYSVRVLMDFSDWPKGMVSWLVIGFSSFGYLTYIFSKAYEEESTSIRFLRKWFPWMVIPQLFMLFYAIGLRIGQYDLTMNRYFVVAFGIWLFIVSLYFIIRRSPLLAFIPAFLALVSFTISVGPWWVFSYPFARQEERLMRNLETAKILQNGKIVPLSSERDISKELSTDIASGIEYLCNFDDCKRIKEIFPDQVRVAMEKSRQDWEKWNKNNTGATYPWMSPYEIQSTIVNELKVQRYNYDDTAREFREQEYLSYNVDYQTSQFPLSITGYDRIVSVMNMDDAKYPNTNLKYPYIAIDRDTEKVTYYTATGVARTFTLIIPEKLKDSATFSTLPPEDLIFDIADDTVSIRLVLQNLEVKNPRFIPTLDDGVSLPYGRWATGLALIKEKK